MTPCSSCGREHATATGKPACRGHRRFDGPGVPLPEPVPCKNAPMNGQRVCHAHGGRAPQSKRAAQRRLVTQAIEMDAEALLAAEGIHGISDPVAEIGRLAAEALALKRAAGARANALTDIRYTGGLERNRDGELVGTGTEQLRAEVALYERALDRSMKFLEIVTRHTGKQDVDDANAMLRKLGAALGIGTVE